MRTVFARGVQHGSPARADDAAGQAGGADRTADKPFHAPLRIDWSGRLVLRERVSAVNGDEQEWYAGQLEGLWNNAIIMRTGVQSWIRILPSADLTTDSLPHTCQRRLRFCLCVPSQLSNAQVPANWAFLQILAQSPGNLPTHRPAIRFQEMTVQAPDEDHSWRQQPFPPTIAPPLPRTAASLSRN